MASTFKAYLNNSLWNLGVDDGSVVPVDVLLNPSSNSTSISGQVTFKGDVYTVALTGSFTFNPLRVSFNDVSGTFETFAAYKNGQIWETRSSSVALDLIKTQFGTDLNYLLAGLQGDDVFLGSATSAKNDQARGAGGNDTFTGYDDDSALGGDYFYGEMGIDTSVYRGKLSEYTIAQNPQIYDAIKSDGSRLSGYTVTDKTVGRDGTDKLIEVERLKFSDLNMALDKGAGQNAGEAYRMYKAALDREPDVVGLGGWINALDTGSALTSVASGFIYSQEFRNKYGDNPTNETFVTLLYRNVLHRGPDGPGLAGWVGALDNGASKEQVLIGFSESTENINQTTANLVGIQYQQWV